MESTAGEGELDASALAQLKATFDAFDTDASGKIDAGEMFAMCESLGMVITMPKVLDMIRAVDTDGNDEIDFDELKLIRTVVDRCAEVLERRGMGEEEFKTPLFQRLEERKNPAQVALEVATGGGMRELIHHIALP